MLENNSICNIINSIFPDIKCGEKIKVGYDSTHESWVVKLKENSRVLKTFIEKKDVDSCLEKGECIGVGLDVSLLKDHIKMV